MICTVNFYDKSFTSCQKIYDIITNDMLAKELNSQYLTSNILP